MNLSYGGFTVIVKVRKRYRRKQAQPHMRSLSKSFSRVMAVCAEGSRYTKFKFIKHRSHANFMIRHDYAINFSYCPI